MLKLVKCSDSINSPIAADTLSNSLTHRNQELICSLDNLLDKAKSGDLTALIYVGRLRGEEKGLSVAGEYIQNQEIALQAFCMAHELIGDYLYRHFSQNKK